MAGDTLKILLAVPYPSESSGLIEFYRRAFLSLGHQVHLVSMCKKHGLRDRVRHQLARLSFRGLPPDWDGASLMEAADRFQPDLVIIGRGERLRPEPIRHLRERSRLGCINIYPDSPLVIPGSGAVGILPSMAEYTCVYTFSRALVPVFHQLGARCARWLPFGFDPEMHRIPSATGPALKSTVAYLGAWGPLQETWLAPLAPLGLGIYGPGWRHSRRDSPVRAAWREGRGVGAEMASAIAGADMVFNMVRAEHGCAHSMKTFEIPACGGFMLTNWTEEQAEFFEDGKHCAFFHTREEMLDKATYYAAHADARTKIAAAGHAEAGKHPYTLRAAQILKDCAA
jgi:hypothetical protein